jgi:AraC-like DNA-binding protein
MDSGTDLAQISVDSGFADQAQFTKAFRRLYGVPPGTYRNIIGGLARSARLHFDKTAVLRTRQARGRRS